MSGRYQVGTPIARAGGRIEYRKTVYFPKRVAERLALAAFEQGKDQSEIVSDAVAAHLGLPPAKEARKGKP